MFSLTPWTEAISGCKPGKHKVEPCWGPEAAPRHLQGWGSGRTTPPQPGTAAWLPSEVSVTYSVLSGPLSATFSTPSGCLLGSLPKKQGSHESVLQGWLLGRNRASQELTDGLCVHFSPGGLSGAQRQRRRGCIVPEAVTLGTGEPQQGGALRPEEPRSQKPRDAGVHL